MEVSEAALPEKTLTSRAVRQERKRKAQLTARSAAEARVESGETLLRSDLQAGKWTCYELGAFLNAMKKGDKEVRVGQTVAQMHENIIAYFDRRGTDLYKWTTPVEPEPQSPQKKSKKTSSNKGEEEEEED